MSPGAGMPAVPGSVGSPAGGGSSSQASGNGAGLKLRREQPGRSRRRAGRGARFRGHGAGRLVNRRDTEHDGHRFRVLVSRFAAPRQRRGALPRSDGYWPTTRRPFRQRAARFPVALQYCRGLRALRRPPVSQSSCCSAQKTRSHALLTARVFPASRTCQDCFLTATLDIDKGRDLSEGLQSPRRLATPRWRARRIEEGRE